MKRFTDFWCFFIFIALIYRQTSSVPAAGKNPKALSPPPPAANEPPNLRTLTDNSPSDNKTGRAQSANEQQIHPPVVRQQRLLRKQLRGKQRRLRKLVGEIRGLKAKLASEPDSPSTDAGENGQQAPTTANGTIKRAKTSWRRRVMGELKRLNEQIRILSAYKPISPDHTDQLIDRTNRRRQKLQAGGRRKSTGSTTVPSIVATHKSPAATDDQAKIRLQIRRMRNKRKRLKKIKSMWKTKSTLGSSETPSGLASKVDVAKGEPGYQCKSHKDCRPGSCCHKISSTNSTSICFEHRLDVGSTCANSCQCVHGLNCFRTRKDKLHHKKSTHFDFSISNTDDHQHDHGQCKIASPDDVLHGEYVNNDNSTFTSLEFK